MRWATWWCQTRFSPTKWKKSRRRSTGCGANWRNCRTPRRRAPGYGSTLFPYWDNGTLSADFKEQIPEALQALFHGKEHWTRGPRYRKLGEPVDERPFRMGEWADRPLPETEG